MAEKFAPDQLFSLLEEFKPNLRSIDIRTVAVRQSQDQAWKNILTSMTISDKLVEQVRTEQANARKRIKKTPTFALFTRALPFDYGIFDTFAAGQLNYSPFTLLNTSNCKVAILRFNPLELTLNSRRERSQYVLTTSRRDNSPERQALWALFTKNHILAKRANYNSLPEMIKDVLNNDNSDVDEFTYFTVRVLPNIKLVNPCFAETNFLVSVVNGNLVNNLQLNYLANRTTGYFTNIFWRDIKQLEKGNWQSNGVATLTATPDNETFLPYDQINVELLHSTSAITIDELNVTVPLFEPAEPFYDTLASFCPIPDFEHMLLEPEHHYKDPPRVFETAITWLLSLCGFYTINLGSRPKRIDNKENKFDVLKAKSGYLIGCADIIAYEDNQRILLIDCDLGTPDDKKIDKLIETCNYFKQRTKYQQLKYEPVICTPKPYDRAPSGKSFALIEGNTIKYILVDIAKGDRESARSRIIDSIRTM